MKNEVITKFQFILTGTCTSAHDFMAIHSCGDISLKMPNMSNMLALDKKSGMSKGSRILWEP